jgi:FkbM family methyltransferase
VIKRWIRSLLARAGYGVYRLGPFKLIRADSQVARLDPDRVRTDVLRRGDVGAVVDVGANRGQWAAHLRETGWAGPLFSIEPGAEAHEELARRAAADPLWRTFRLALGEHSGELPLHLAGSGGEASSLRPMLPLHYETAPGSRPRHEESVDVMRLSELLARETIDAGSIYLKLDVQGFEMEVLQGCSAADLRRVVGVEVELSHQTLYEGQALIDAVLVRLYAEGFRLVSHEPVWVHPRTAVCLQSDAILVRLDRLD